MIHDLSIILGNQLVTPSLIPEITKHPVFMCESDDLCTHFKYHPLKIIYFLSTMRHYCDELKTFGTDCFYHQLTADTQQNYLDVLYKFCTHHDVKNIHTIEIEDHFFAEKIDDFCKQHQIKLTTYDSPMFLTTRNKFDDYIKSTKKPFMKTFYESQRKQYKILMDGNKPIGGKYSFDEDNRKKTPKSISFPSTKSESKSHHLQAVKELVSIKFDTHYGSPDNCWFPVTRTDIHKWLDRFIDERFELFGDYEDAIDYRSDFLFHSGLSAFINSSLLTPLEIIEKIKLVEDRIPLNSYEGFVRQIIGWREFIRGIYHHFDDHQQQSNFFNHQNRLNSSWYDGTTGITPLDDAIKQVLNLGYTHHINRLMVIGNMMMMCNIHPHDVYKWFMELFIDSSDWVMGPNVFGMSQFSDGGIFATKPYFCGSNYVRKMSHYPKGDWCQVMDALYWNFINQNKDFFSKNYRMKFMVSKINSYSSEKLDTITSVSARFIDSVTK